MKKCFSILTAISLLLVLSMPAFAANEDTSSLTVRGSVNLDDSQVVVSEPMLLQEMAQHMAVEEGISVTEAITILGGNAKVAIEPRVITYRTIELFLKPTGVSNGASYNPILRYYCKTDESNTSGGFLWSIISILNTTIDTRQNGISKPFEGDIYTNLESGTTFYYDVTGTFYSTGTTTTTGNVEIGVGEIATVSFSVSYATNYYASVSQVGRYHTVN